MSTAIFIKSYANDFKWLNYCLKSIDRYVTGYSEVIVMLDSGSNIHLHELTVLPNKIRIEWIDKQGDGYIFQQYCKLMAHHYTNSDKIMFIDSDCMFTRHIDLRKLDEIPEILYTDYKHVGDAICWRVCTEKVIKQPVGFEFMRRNGLIYWRSTLVNFETFVGDLGGYVLNQNTFSEFNALGAYAWIYEHEKYRWVNTLTEQFGEPLVNQKWSHGELNEVELNNILNESN